MHRHPSVSNNADTRIVDGYVESLGRARFERPLQFDDKMAVAVDLGV
jgi:hypothetical protein